MGKYKGVRYIKMSEYARVCCALSGTFISVTAMEHCVSQTVKRSPDDMFRIAPGKKHCLIIGQVCFLSSLLVVKQLVSYCTTCSMNRPADDSFRAAPGEKHCSIVGQVFLVESAGRKINSFMLYNLLKKGVKSSPIHIHTGTLHTSKYFLLDLPLEHLN
jgi:hypothetical protein